MKKVLRLSVVLLITMMFSCQKGTEQLVIEGTVVGIPDQEITLKNASGAVLQTANIVNGKFAFTETAEVASIYDLSLTNKDYWLLGREVPMGLILADNGQHIAAIITVENPENPKKSFSGQIFPKIEITNSSPSYLKLKEFNKEVEKEFGLREEENNKGFMSLNIDWSKVDQKNQKESLGEETFKKLTNLREKGKQIREEKQQYLEKIIEDKSNSLKALFALHKMFNAMIEKPENKVRYPSFYASISEEIKNTGLGLGIKKYLDAEKQRKLTLEGLAIGKKYKDFTAPNQYGKDVTLSTVMGKGKYIFIDFWASWCGPCRSENPNVLKMYNKYHDKGLEIVAYSLDKSKNTWLKAIKDDAMPWIHLSDLDPKSQVIKDYGISGIPMNYLIDGDTGTIVASNLREESLFSKLDELFKDK